MTFNTKNSVATIFFAVLYFPALILAQNPGDTIRVKTLHYGTNNRDTIAFFPKGNLTFEKIILRYNLRCKNGLVSDGSNRNKGCGEWDYSCNTFLVDSSKVETIAQTAPHYSISNYKGNTFNYTVKPVSDYYDYSLKRVTVNSVSNEKNYAIGNGNLSLANVLKTSEKSGKTQMLYRSSELLSAGFSAGDIQALVFNAINTGTANFFKVGVQQSSLNQLHANSPVLNGFTEVFNNTYTFAKGENKIVFHTPFTWDGKSNLIIEFSFTNSTQSNALLFQGFLDTATCMLSANNNYAVDFSANGHIVINAFKLSSIKNEISIAFWAFGDPQSLPRNTSVIYAWATDQNQRQLNIHFPWSDGSIYFDCGHAAGNFDRINKGASANEYAGKWNHWVFTKNASTGMMSVYLNGTVWLSGTSKTKTMSLMNVILGKDQNFQNNYKGKINDLSIWNTALSASEVKDWMNKSIDNTHPKYANLLAYYPFNEGTGKNVNDTVFGLVSKSDNIQWTYERGTSLSRMFKSFNSKPNITLLTGNYSNTTVGIVQRDSIVRNPNTIDRYTVIDHSGSKIVTHDQLKIDSSFSAFEASKSMVFNGDNGVLIDSIVNQAQGKIYISDLNYALRFPWFNELVSFVTPYGINLDLGMTGKNWFFNLSDFAPLLKGKKRIVVSMGGQNQENMELEFLFIVGTPPRNILDFNQLWQGGARLGGPGINSILNNSVFAPMKVTLLSNAKSFNMRSTITGHGSDGEFEQNGGPIVHTVNVEGNSMNWNSVMDCSINPMIAQGGTWLIPRQGWCPGWRSKLIEHDITKWVTPGNVETFDYEISQPVKSGGDYRYIVAHQLVSYGDLNFNLDAKIVNIIKPSTDFEYAKSNPICSQPVILVQNTGKTALKTIKFEYWANSSAVKQTWHWAGNLASLDTIGITLPSWGLWDNGLLASNNVFHCEIKELNGGADEYPLNSKASNVVKIPDVLPGNFKIEFKTNNYPTENAITLLDVDGKVVLHDTFLVANKLTTYTYNLNGCYKFIVNDYGLDGLNWWANTAQGTGYVRFRNATTNAIVKTFNADFGSYFEYNFTANYSLHESPLAFENSIQLYPNPAKDKFSLVGDNLENSSVVVLDVLGKIADSKSNIQDSQVDFCTANWNPGIYLVVLSKGKSKTMKKVVVY